MESADVRFACILNHRNTDTQFSNSFGVGKSIVLFSVYYSMYVGLTLILNHYNRQKIIDRKRVNAHVALSSFLLIE